MLNITLRNIKFWQIKSINMKILMKIFLVVFIFWVSEVLQAQPITWRRTYLAKESEIFSIVPSDNGYISVGIHRNQGEKMFAMGLNLYGDSLWFRFYKHEFGLEIFKLMNEKYMIISKGAELVKINSIGEIIWTKLPKHNLRCFKAKFINNEYYICGENYDLNFKPFLLKLDRSRE